MEVFKLRGDDGEVYPIRASSVEEAFSILDDIAAQQSGGGGGAKRTPDGYVPHFLKEVTGAVRGAVEGFNEDFVDPTIKRFGEGVESFKQGDPVLGAAQLAASFPGAEYAADLSRHGGQAIRDALRGEGSSALVEASKALPGGQSVHGAQQRFYDQAVDQFERAPQVESFDELLDADNWGRLFASNALGSLHGLESVIGLTSKAGTKKLPGQRKPPPGRPDGRPSGPGGPGAPPAVSAAPPPRSGGAPTLSGGFPASLRDAGRKAHAFSEKHPVAVGMAAGAVGKMLPMKGVIGMLGRAFQWEGLRKVRKEIAKHFGLTEKQTATKIDALMAKVPASRTPGIGIEPTPTNAYPVAIDSARLGQVQTSVPNVPKKTSSTGGATPLDFDAARLGQVQTSAPKKTSSTGGATPLDFDPARLGQTQVSARASRPTDSSTATSVGGSLRRELTAFEDLDGFKAKLHEVIDKGATQPEVLAVLDDIYAKSGSGDAWKNIAKRVFAELDLRSLEKPRGGAPGGSLAEVKAKKAEIADIRAQKPGAELAELLGQEPGVAPVGITLDRLTIRQLKRLISDPDVLRADKLKLEAELARKEASLDVSFQAGRETSLEKSVAGDEVKPRFPRDPGDILAAHQEPGWKIRRFVEAGLLDRETITTALKEGWEVPRVEAAIKAHRTAKK